MMRHKLVRIFVGMTLVYVVSIESGNVRKLDTLLDIQDWDPQTGFFISTSPCEQDPQGWRALDSQGSLHCVPQPVPTPSPSLADEFPAPEGKHSLTVKDGLWLAGKGQVES